jgi:peptide/nickel transport system permease protein
MKSVKLWLGVAALAILVTASAGYPWLSALPFAPACPFGMDLEIPSETVCARTLGGLWRSVGLGLVAGSAACLIALGLATLGRRFGGWVDTLIEKSADLLFAIPDVLVLIAVGFAVKVIRGGEDGVSIPWMLASLTAIGWAAPTRQLQNRLRSLARQEFVQAAEALGASRLRIVIRHLLPFAWDYLLALFLLRVPSIILTESTVSFLGFGLPPDQPSLGKYVGANASRIVQGEWRVIGPAWLLLVGVVVAFQAVGSGMLARTRSR